MTAAVRIVLGLAATVLIALAVLAIGQAGELRGHRRNERRLNRLNRNLTQANEGWQQWWQNQQPAPVVPVWHDFLNPAPDLPADDIARFLADAEAHANQEDAG
jgi:hypothetical protein